MNTKLIALIFFLTIISTAQNLYEELDACAQASVRQFFSEQSSLTKKNHTQASNGSIQVQMKYQSGLEVTIRRKKSGDELQLVQFRLPKGSPKIQKTWKEACANSKSSSNSQAGSEDSIKADIIKSLISSKSIDETYEFNSLQPNRQGYQISFIKGRWLIRINLSKDYSVASKRLEIYKPTEEKTVQKPEVKQVTVKKIEKDVKEKEETTSKIIKPETTVKEKQKPIQKPVAKETQRKIGLFLDAYLKAEKEGEQVYQLDTITFFGEKQDEYEINVTLSKMGMPYRIVLQYTPSETKDHFKILSSSYVVSDKFKKQAYKKYNGSMKSPLILELERLIKLSLTNLNDKDNYEVKQVELAEPFMHVSFFDESNNGFFVYLVFDRFVNKITLLEVTQKSKTQVKAEVKTDSRSVKAEEKTVKVSSRANTTAQETKQKVIDESRNDKNKDSGKSEGKQVISQRDNEDEHKIPIEKNPKAGSVRQYGSQIKSKVVYREINDDSELYGKIEEIPDKYFVNLKPENKILGPMAEASLTKMIMSMGKFDPTFKLKEVLFLLRGKTVVMKFYFSVRGTQKQEFHEKELTEKQREDIQKIYKEEYEKKNPRTSQKQVSTSSEAFEKEQVVEQSEKITTQPKKVTEQAKTSERQEPKKVIEEPKKVREEPKKVKEEPKEVLSKTKKDEPKKEQTKQQPKKVVEQTKNNTNASVQQENKKTEKVEQNSDAAPKIPDNLDSEEEQKPKVKRNRITVQYPKQLQIEKKQLNSILLFLIKNYESELVKEDTVLKIHRVDVNVRAIRLVIQVGTMIYNSIVEIKNSSDQKYEALSWKSLESLDEVSETPFEKYFSENYAEQLKDVVKKVKFLNSVSLRRILSSEKKPSPEGIYYRIIIEVEESGKLQEYLLVIYFNEENDVAEVIEFENLQLPYSFVKEIQLKESKEDKVILEKYNQVKEVLKRDDRFPEGQIVYTGYQIEEISNIVIFRVIVESRNLKGNYQIMMSANLKIDWKPTLIKYIKLNEGYVALRKNFDREASLIIKAIESDQSQVKRSEKIKVDQNSVLVKKIAGKGEYFRMMVSSENGFDSPRAVIAFKKEGSQKIEVSGIEDITYASSNKNYRHSLFRGYREVKDLDEFIANDERYESMIKLLVGSLLDGKQSEIVGVFFRKTDQGESEYRMIFKSIQKLYYIATFSHKFRTDEYTLLQVKEYSQLPEDGNFKWKCRNNNEANGFCEKCDSPYILTNGRCYEKIQWCEAQVAGICWVCRAGSYRNKHGDKCYGEPTTPEVVKTEELPIEKQTDDEDSDDERESKGEKIILSLEKEEAEVKLKQPYGLAVGQSKIISRVIEDKDRPAYNANTDFNCMRPSPDGRSCVKCLYRFYPDPKTGKCETVSHTCSRYDRETGECFTCYTGYSLIHGKCKQIDPLCAATDSSGECRKCYNGYTLYNSGCYYEANVKTGHNDKLCETYHNGACIKCLSGSYYSQIEKRCELKDPHCYDFNEEQEFCEICYRGYGVSLSTGRCTERK